MKKYAQLEYSFTDAEIDLKSREALKKQFNNLPQHWYKRMSRYNWKIVVVDELIDAEDGTPLIFNVAYDEMTIYLNSSSTDALRNGVYKAIAGYIIAQHMTFDDSVVFQVLVDENYDKMEEFFRKRHVSHLKVPSILFVELFSFVIETKGKNPFTDIDFIYEYVNRWVTGDIFIRNLKHIPEYISVGNDVVDENIFKAIKCFSELPQNVQNVFVNNGWKIRISSEYLMDSPDCEGYCDPNVKKIFFKAAVEQFKSSLWHEVGHFIDFQCDYPSGSSEFAEIFKKEKGYLMRENNTYEFYKYCTMNEKEYFAESFANYMNDSYKLQMVAPGTFGIIDRIVR